MDDDSTKRPQQYNFVTLYSAWEVSSLGLLLWREARGESHDTRMAVACCVRNRVRKPSWWGRTYSEVIYKKWQFSSLTDPKDKQLCTWPIAEDPVFRQCLNIAYAVIRDSTVESPFPGADSYYDDSIPPPYWATQDTYVGQSGAIRFHNLDRDIEPVLRSLAT